MPLVRLTKDINPDNGLIKGATFDWPRMALSAYEDQWGPRAEWMEYVGEETSAPTRSRGTAPKAAPKAKAKTKAKGKPGRPKKSKEPKIEAPEIPETTEEIPEVESARLPDLDSTPTEEEMVEA